MIKDHVGYRFYRQILHYVYSEYGWIISGTAHIQTCLHCTILWWKDFVHWLLWILRAVCSALNFIFLPYSAGAHAPITLCHSLMNSAMCVRACIPVHALLYIQYNFMSYYSSVATGVAAMHCMCHMHIWSATPWFEAALLKTVFILVNHPVLFLHMSAGGDGMESWGSECVTVVDEYSRSTTTLQARSCNKLGALKVSKCLCAQLSVGIQV